MRPDTPETQTLEVRGSRTVLHAYGPESGAGILAIHGFRGTHHGLEPLARSLAALGYRVLVPDLPGAGRSTPLHGTHDAIGYGAWLAELAQGLPAVKLLLGHSFGSVIVGSAMAQGARADGAVLVNPILQPPLQGPRRLATAAARLYYGLARWLPDPLGHRLLASKLIAGIAGSLMTSTTDPALRRWIRDEHLRHAGAFASRRVVLEGFIASTATTVADFADRITAPALVIGGACDPLSPSPACAVDAAGMRAATLHVFPDHGHLLPYEETHALSQVIAAWDRERSDPATVRGDEVASKRPTSLA